ncbi:MAG TPA: LuxR C-terminal-related transcriptional regulator [Solirubrobacteraceae bacterium]|jgi:DNA-binding NarL/FixJ family response regulator|nr:LuxR C-terminal-related transcriptional regulator [Solirubrobacteraceae bacterium]
MSSSRLLADALVSALTHQGFDVSIARVGTENNVGDSGSWQPDVALVDGRPVSRDFTRALTVLKEEGIPVIVLGDSNSPSSEFLPRSVGIDEIVVSLHQALKRLTSTANESRSNNQLGPVGAVPQRAWPEAFAILTPREQRVLAELMEGHTADQIAKESWVSVSTVRSQIKSILHKLGVNSQLAAVAMAWRAGWRPVDGVKSG